MVEGAVAKPKDANPVALAMDKSGALWVLDKRKPQFIKLDDAGNPVVADSSARKATLTPMSGRIFGSSLSNEMRTLTVAFCRSAVGMTVRTRAGIRQSG